MAKIDVAGRYGLAEYFRAEMEKIQSPTAGEDTRYYLGSMLDRFSRSEQLFSYDEFGSGLRPLALIYGDAHKTLSQRERCELLRQLGDQALFTGALFPEFYQRKGLARDYFISMGGSAYGYLADTATSMRDIFSELAERFSQMLELVARVVNRYRKLDANELLALYQRWEATGDTTLAAQLRELGVILTPRGVKSS